MKPAQNSANAPGSKSRSLIARNTRASTSCRRMLRLFEQVPRDRALKQVRRSCDERMNPPPHISHAVNPEKRYLGRRTRAMPLFNR